MSDTDLMRGTACGVMNRVPIDRRIVGAQPKLELTRRLERHVA